MINIECVKGISFSVTGKSHNGKFKCSQNYRTPEEAVNYFAEKNPRFKGICELNVHETEYYEDGRMVYKIMGEVLGTFNSLQNLKEFKGE
ncbi:MAG: hypothetical protein KGI50_05415 [Patescibacteria group bacterium]|nr:hypothetical protein [Patescibacteria group bacterium]MDE2438756.1 hypothetical protein [Patescibacteria group bacterium]